MTKGVILGAGVMGSAMAVVASDRGHNVALVGTPLDELVLRSFEERRLHAKLGVTLLPQRHRLSVGALWQGAPAEEPIS